ncbi:hypothetical protein HMPREF3159_16460 [Brachybacterium sp. HMSC06H03]|nr:hypothetical protein HMPREF3159_16460 [Brachybacterium sp. HMSC06H03]
MRKVAPALFTTASIRPARDVAASNSSSIPESVVRSARTVEHVTPRASASDLVVAAAGSSRTYPRTRSRPSWASLSDVALPIPHGPPVMSARRFCMAPS